MDRISYNATVRGITMVTPDLMIFQIETDEPRQEFLAGQNMLLGLYGREKRSPNSEPESELGVENQSDARKALSPPSAVRVNEG